jgi:hypothetical protein
MKLGKASSVEELQVINRYQNLRKLLLSEQYTDHIEKPLAYWALPTDRRLPLAFLGRSLKELLGTPFFELTATPGIGQKKIRSFVNLLARVANTNPSELPTELADPCSDETPPVPHAANGEGRNGDCFDPATVSEVVWAQWRASVVKHDLGRELLGRFAPSLQNMTRVIWSAPLETYTRCTLCEIRGMKTHGEKRVRAILEVFHSVHALVSNLGRQPHLVVRIVPRLIHEVQEWLADVLQAAGVPSREEICRRFICPLLEQIRTDATQQITTLAENRLGIQGPIASVRQAARTMGLTRARVYQLLNEINDIMNVRWPTGRQQVYELSEKFRQESEKLDQPPDLSQFAAAVELLYPGARRGGSALLEAGIDALDAADDDAEEDGQPLNEPEAIEEAGLPLDQPVVIASGNEAP